MTDAAVPVTQSAVETFTERYLRTLGCDIDKQGNRWTINAPDEVESELLTESLTLVCGDDVDDENAEPLYPESPFFQTLLTEASERTPSGKIAFQTEETDIQIPDWLRASEVEVRKTDFTPYYDRTAIVVLFQVSIETVSEYQSEFLKAVAVDTRSEDHLPALEQTFLEITSPDTEALITDQADITPSDVQPLLETAREQVVERAQDTIDEIHQEASRAADAEVEEFRQMQQQRIQEFEAQQSNLSEKIDDLSDRISSSDEDERVDALKERKELKTEYEDVDAELNDLRQRRDQGFPDRQREIRARHALDVRVKPRTITEVEYERGEIELKLATEEQDHTITVGYGSGVGVTETVRCESCGNPFSESLPLDTIEEGLWCEDCSSGVSD
ncbi:hypothetical protein EGH22_09785 [Halomicroarcula sp. F28]|uniref:hypothetical protein n=1 Tax=Haloarcula salinisoli TaxID=2487746 RepID=UPI001C732F3E|nr:hypothetical protein [Halomicroarcula salinisoli]MBX0286617.1 hypothetical protein [Halomicroarcula salinisoli]